MTMSSIIGAAASKAGRPSGVNPFWDSLNDDVNVIVPVTILAYDQSFFAKVGADLSGWVCSMGSGHNASEATAARRPTDDGTDIVFAVGDTNHMLLDFSSAVGANNWTWLWGVDIVSVLANNFRHMQAHAAGFLTCGHNATEPADQIFYDGAARGTKPMITGSQYLAYEMNSAGGNSAAIRRTGALLEGGLGYTQRALGGDSYLGCHSNGSLAHFDMKLRFRAIASGIDTADTAIWEALAATEMGL